MMTRLAPALAALTALVFSGCASAPPGAETQAPGLDRGLLWTVDSAEYRAAAIQAFSLAQERIEVLAEGREPGTWAVAVDADETVLNNTPYMLRRADAGIPGFDWASWNDWCREEAAEPVPGALAFLHRVRELGGKIAVVTNRREDVRDVTWSNLEKQGVPFDLLLVRPQGGPGDKEPRWQSLQDGTASPELGPLDILLWVGDNIGDFPDLDQDLRHRDEDAFALFGDRYVVIPNPVYGSWERNREN
jgi:5'-nucleotidase (lipoprotein e(P4) family)